MHLLHPLVIFLSLFQSSVLSSPLAGNETDLQLTQHHQHKADSRHHHHHQHKTKHHKAAHHKNAHHKTNHKHKTLHERKSKGPHVAIKGIHNSGIQPRLEIRTMEASHPAQFNLFLLAMIHFKAQDQNRKTSYFQISAIHGFPNVPWDGVKANPHVNTATTIGYCTHGSNLFPTWHRPYVALFEQSFYEVVKATAAQYKGAKHAKYAQAAKTIRLPYWDWAINPPAGGNNIPKAFTNPFVELDTPTGRKKFVNPLFRYTFHPLPAAAFEIAPYNAWPNTLRHPTSAASNANSAVSQLIATCNNERSYLKQAIYNMFTLQQPYNQFANAAAGGYNSIENAHNVVHGMVGGGSTTSAYGHMTVLSYSAFDPIFWMHHSNVDRLLALWQRTHENEWITPAHATSPTFTIANHSIQGPDSPLKPFHRTSAGAFWTSKQVRKWTEFGYTYPEFKNSNGSPGAIRAAINRKYGPNSSVHAAKRGLDLNITGSIPAPLIGAITTPNGSYYEYMANIQADRNGLNGSYGIYVFLGDLPAAVSDWATAPNLVGANYIFTSPGAANMGTLVVGGSVPLTAALVDQVSLGALATLESALVVPFLAQQLHWGVAQNGASVDPSAVPHFRVEVVGAELTPGATDEDFPTWGPMTTYVNATHGKAGGLGLKSLGSGIFQIGGSG